MGESRGKEKCPYCLGEIPAEARKCMHCGEWVKKGAAARYGRTLEDPAYPDPHRAMSSTGSLSRFFRGRNLDETLNEGVKVWAKFQIAGLIVAGIGMLVILGNFCAAQEPRFPGGLQPEIMCTTEIISGPGGFACS